MPIRIEEYLREDGSSPYAKWVIDCGPGYRIYLAKDGDALIVLFGGGTKRGQQRDIDQAKALLAEYKARKKMAAQAAAKAGPGPRKR